MVERDFQNQELAQSDFFTWDPYAAVNSAREAAARAAAAIAHDLQTVKWPWWEWESLKGQIIHDGDGFSRIYGHRSYMHPYNKEDFFTLKDYNGEHF